MAIKLSPEDEQYAKKLGAYLEKRTKQLMAEKLGLSKEAAYMMAMIETGDMFKGDGAGSG